MNRRGLLLVNLGTPARPETPEVRRYLRQFLSDRRVLDISPLKRALVLYLLILPFRSPKTAAAYRKIWTDRGSPLLLHGLNLVTSVGARLGDDVQVELGMRYGSPSLESALEKFRASGIDRITVFPMFPQYASSSTGSAVEEVFAVASRCWNLPSLCVVPAFYDHPAFLDAEASVVAPVIEPFRPDRVLMSFHGLPERHILRSDDSARHCLRSESCCDEIVGANRFCYRAQCFSTARGIAARTGLDDGSYEVTFQSRLGRSPWIRPHTDARIIELARAGVRKLAVLCPAFVADCLETLEEISIRARESFREHGGEDLLLVPSLNSEDRWADAVVEIVRDHLQLT